MALECAHALVSLSCGIKVPQLDQIIASTSDKSPERLCLARGRLSAGELARSETGAPGYSIDAKTVGLEDCVGKGVVGKSDDRDVAI